MRLKILVVDDEESIRDSLRWYLEGLGHEVHTASEPGFCDVFCGHHCKKSVKCGDALIIDYHMPGMNGLEFVEALKKRGCRGVVTNTLLMSGYTGEIDIEKAQELGCTVVEKPVGFDFLDSWLETVTTSA